MYKLIMVALDGTEAAETGLDHAIGLARVAEAEVLLVRVVRPLPEGCNLSSLAADRYFAMLTAAAQEYLLDVAEQVRRCGVPVRTAIGRGPPDRELTRIAESENVDMLVVSKVKRSLVSRWLRPTVADRLMRNASVPLLIVQATDEARIMWSALHGGTGRARMPASSPPATLET